jgi:hypothetical protein
MKARKVSTGEWEGLPMNQLTAAHPVPAIAPTDVGTTPQVRGVRTLGTGRHLRTAATPFRRSRRHRLMPIPNRSRATVAPITMAVSGERRYALQSATTLLLSI